MCVRLRAAVVSQALIWGQPVLLSSDINPLRVTQVILWVLGEYGSLADVGSAGVLVALGELAERRPPSELVRGYLISAVAKLCAQVVLQPFFSLTLGAGRCCDP